MNLDIGTKGQQRVQVLRKGKVIKDTGFQDNMLLNRFFHKLTNVSDTFDLRDGHYMSVGSGTTPPTEADTVLESVVFSRYWSPLNVADNDAVVDNDKGVLRCLYEREFAFTEGQVVGNISEIGTVFSVSHGAPKTLDTRALVRDDQGQPTTIVVTADDQLIVTHRLYIEYSLTPNTGTFDTGGVTYTWNWCPVNGSSYYSTIIMAVPYELAIARLATSTFSRLYAQQLNFPITQAGQTLSTNALVSQRSEFPTTLDKVDTGDIMVGRIVATYAASVANENPTLGVICIGNSQTRPDRVPSVLWIEPGLPKDNRHKMTVEMTITYARV